MRHSPDEQSIDCSVSSDLANSVDSAHSLDREFVDCGTGDPDRLQRLWAPFRMAYITKKSDDPFVAAPQQSDEDGLIIARGKLVYAIVNLFPYNAGHLMIVPYRKERNFEDLTDAETAELIAFSKKAIRVLKKVSQPEGINVGFNLGRAAGGSVSDHLHLHVVPRWPGDSNFMTVLGNTKVLPQLLRETRAILAEAWQELEQSATDNHTQPGVEENGA